MAFPIARVLLQIGQFAISYVQNSDRRVGKCLSLSFLSADRNERLRTYRLIAGGRRNKPRPADNHSREREKIALCSFLWSYLCFGLQAGQSRVSWSAYERSIASWQFTGKSVLPGTAFVEHLIPFFFGTVWEVNRPF